MEPQLEYPRWYLALRGFVIGAGSGSALTHGLFFDQAVTSGVWKHPLILPTLIGAAVLSIIGTFEVFFTVRHYRRLRREITGRRNAS